MAYKTLETLDAGSDEGRFFDSHGWGESSAVWRSRRNRWFIFGSMALLFAFLAGSNVAMMLRIADLKQNLQKDASSTSEQFCNLALADTIQRVLSQWRTPGKPFIP
jgi:hypothetical protein